MHVALDLSPAEARAVHQQADPRTAYVVAWTDSTTDSTSAQPTVLEHRSGSDPSEVALRFPKLTDSVAGPSDYVAYFFGARPDHSVGAGPRSTTVDSTAVPSSWPEDLTYGIAFHKSRARVLYWSDWER